MASETTDERSTHRIPWERITALTGAASVIVLHVGSAIGDTGGKGIDPTMGPDAIVAGTRPLVGELQVAASLLCLSAVLLLVFLGPLWRRLRTASEGAAVVGVAGGVLGAGLLVSYARNGIAMATAADLGDGTTAQVLVTSDWETARILAVPFLAMVVAAVVAGFSPGVFPVWFRWFSAVMAVLLVLALAPVGPAGLMGLLGSLWVLVASVLLAAQARSH
jgi:hypothetical protein